MKTRRLSQGVVEAYNDQVRIRLHPPLAQKNARVTFFILKPNGYYRDKISLEVQWPVSIKDVVKTYYAFAAKVG